MSDEFHRKYRPTNFKQVIGQDAIVSSLSRHVKKSTLPHFLMLHGPSGCGKTTLARVVASAMGIDPCDITEVNAATTKGIDMVRDIVQSMPRLPLASTARMYIIDEAQQLMTAAQDAFLKSLEEPPSHVYFAICTTDPHKIKATIKNRASQYQVKLLSADDLERLVTRVCKKESIELEEVVINRLIKVAEGSARQALVLLGQIAHLQEEDQMGLLSKADAEAAGIELCRALINPRVKWPEVASILKRIEQEPESVRRQVLGYASAVLLNGKDSKRAALILESFETHLYDVGKPGLILQAYRVYAEK